ncbi:MAG: hypothetical protein ACREQ7_25030, partial [Candidatus Binatia bacterium]
GLGRLLKKAHLLPVCVRRTGRRCARSTRFNQSMGIASLHPSYGSSTSELAQRMEQRAGSMEQRAKSKVQRAKSTESAKSNL